MCQNPSGKKLWTSNISFLIGSALWYSTFDSNLPPVYLDEYSMTHISCSMTQLRQLSFLFEFSQMKSWNNTRSSKPTLNFTFLLLFRYLCSRMLHRVSDFNYNILKIFFPELWTAAKIEKALNSLLNDKWTQIHPMSEGQGARKAKRMEVGAVIVEPTDLHFNSTLWNWFLKTSGQLSEWNMKRLAKSLPLAALQSLRFKMTREGNISELRSYRMDSLNST